jgi:putative flippase GtrA
MLATILIPAYKPGPDFVDFILELTAAGVRRIVVVDDGSGTTYRASFDAVARVPGVHVVRHAINLGKGAALKTGINTILCDYPDTPVVVTADADRQHHPDDVVSVAQFAEKHPDVLVLGSRNFGHDVPLRSRFGNKVTSTILRAVVGQRLRDTQTGLRAIPYSLLAALMKIASQGYEFELDMLLLCQSRRFPIVEVPIRTIYLHGNSSSHFNPLLDSMRIYFVLLRFTIVATFTAVLDNVVFSLLFVTQHSLVTSQLGGRFVAMIFNFTAVKRVVFNSPGNAVRQFAWYATLVALSGTVSFGLIGLLMKSGIGVLSAKLIAEGILFLANFLVQRDFIFTASDRIDAEDERRLRAAAASAAQWADWNHR